MSELSNLLKELQDIALNPKKSVRDAMSKTGKKAVGCFPIYAPEELVYAAGFIPVGLWGGQSDIKLADKYLQSFCCSIMRENLEQGMKGTYDFLSAIILPTYCDTLKCICENWKVAVPQVPFIPMVYPQNRKIEAGKEYLEEEFKRVIRKLEDITQEKISDNSLRESVDLYNDYRRTMQKLLDITPDYSNTINAKVRHLIIKAAYFMDKSDYLIKIKKIIELLNQTPKEKLTGKKIVLTGLIAEPLSLLDLLVDNGFVVVADDLAQESRQFRTISDIDDPIKNMVDRISKQDGCAFLYDSKKTRGELLINLVQKNNANGVVVSMLKFCDPEEFDYPIYKKELEKNNIPMLYLEIEQKMDSVESLRTRIQSFNEML